MLTLYDNKFRQKTIGRLTVRDMIFPPIEKQDVLTRIMKIRTFFIN